MPNEILTLPLFHICDVILPDSANHKSTEINFGKLVDVLEYSKNKKFSYFPNKMCFILIFFYINSWSGKKSDFFK